MHRDSLPARRRYTRLAGSADALALARLAARRASRSRSIAATALDAQRLVEEIAWFAPELRGLPAAGLGDAALRPVLAAPGPGLRAPRHALPHPARRLRHRWSCRRTTALVRLCPPAYIAALHVSPAQGETARRRDSCKRSSRSRATSTSRRWWRPGEYCCPRRPDRPLPDGQRAALPHRPLRRRGRRDHAPSTSTRSARSTR